MTPVFPYIVQHLQLRYSQNFSFPEIDSSGYYCVCWWDDTPLGHFFFEKGETAKEADIKQKIAAAIKPTVEFYMKQTTTEKSDEALQTAFKNFNFQVALDKVFKEIIILPAGNKSVDISVVICTRNRTNYLRRCIDSLLQQKYQPAEIIVVDNAPSDDSTEELVKQYNKVVYCRELVAGLDRARNAGACVAKYSIVAYTDDDVLLHPLWTYQVWKTFQDPDVAAMTGLVIAKDLHTQSQQIFEKFWSFNRGYIDKAFNDIFFQRTLPDGPPVWEIGAGANMAFRKKVLKELHFFDLRLDVGAAGCSGDSEMWFRILSAGYKIHYNPRAICYHDHRKEMKALQRQLFYYMRGYTVAALIQQDAVKEAKYRKLLLGRLPKYYFRLFVRGFLRKDLRHTTLWSEVRGIFSGWLYYKKHKNTRA